MVDDSMEDAELTIRALQKENLASNLLHLEDGEDALHFLFSVHNQLPRVILLDLKMPKIDGLEVLRQLKTDSRLSKIPVVVMTSSKEERDIAETYRLGVNAYIVKPVDIEKFMKAVSEIGIFWLRLNEVPG